MRSDRYQELARAVVGLTTSQPNLKKVVKILKKRWHTGLERVQALDQALGYIKNEYLLDLEKDIHKIRKGLLEI